MENNYRKMYSFRIKTENVEMIYHVIVLWSIILVVEYGPQISYSHKPLN